MFKIPTPMQHKLIFQYLISVANSIKISMVFIKNRLFDIPHAIYVYSKGTKSPPNTQSSFASCLVTTSTPHRMAISAAVVTCYNMRWGSSWSCRVITGKQNMALRYADREGGVCLRVNGDFQSTVLTAFNFRCSQWRIFHHDGDFFVRTPSVTTKKPLANFSMYQRINLSKPTQLFPFAGVAGFDP